MAKDSYIRARVTDQQKEEFREFWDQEGWNSESDFVFYVAKFYKDLRELGYIENHKKRSGPVE